jgi:hypothetical protein
LLVIGIHTPEFSFEKHLDNVRRAATDLTVRHPIAVDNDYALWQAFANHYWPALYFVDVQGRIRHHHFAEGAYERSEQTIQQLLLEAGVRGITRELVSPDARCRGCRRLAQLEVAGELPGLCAHPEFCVARWSGTG